MIATALLRLADDIVDSEIPKEEKYEFLAVFERFLNEIFKNHLSDQELLTVISSRADIRYDASHLDWNYYQRKLSVRQLSVFRSFSRIAYYLPRKPFDDLIKGFKLDIEKKIFKNENEFLQYARYVSGSSAILCIYIFLFKSGNWPRNFENDVQQLIENGSNLGLVSIGIFI